jgi:hypothetical protein
MYDDVNKLLGTLDKTKVPAYEGYFDTLRPKNERDKFRRGLFALASVHTTWALNCELYAALWDLKWLKDPKLLRERIIESRAGLVNNRVKSITAYAALFWQFPGIFDRESGETWYQYRDRIQGMTHGLGPAKSAFFIELMHFHDSRIPCMDTHMYQAYGILPKDVGKVKDADRVRMETHWDMTCDKRGLNPVTARWIVWDQKQGKSDSRYWAQVLEGKPKRTERMVQETLAIAS